MAKGKYAAKALNRAAAIDNDVIVELRHKLAAADDEIKALTEKLNEAGRQIHSHAMSEAGRIAQDEIRSLHDELQEQDQKHRAHLEALAFDLLDLYAEHDCAVGENFDAKTFNTEFAELFGLSDRTGEILDYVESFNRRERQRNSNRRSRRATSTARKIRSQVARLKDIQRNPGRFGHKAPEGGLYYGRVSVTPDEIGLPR